ncbi:MAG: hypothetical protein EXR98_09505 [Gemmataceae bacterium]|nr:hypothetical protein [Gemmataceae bacterium]
MTRIKPLVLVLLCLALQGGLLTPSWGDEPTKTPGKQPNLLIDVSAGLINAAVQRSIDRTGPVREVIQDTPVQGTSRTIGAVWAELVPNTSHGVIDVALRGNVYSRTIATRPFVLINTATETPLEVRNRVLIDEKGICIYHGPASATATTTLLDISSRAEPDFIAIRVAEQGYHRSKRNAEAESASKAAWRASKYLADELSATLTAAGKVVKAIQETGLAVEYMNFSTTATSIHTKVRVGTLGKKEASAVPTLPAEIDLGVRIHESVLNEAARIMTGGKSFGVHEVNRFYEKVSLGLLLDGRSDHDKKDLLKNLEAVLTDLVGKETMITLAKNDPLIVSLGEQTFTAEIHVASIASPRAAYAGSRVKAAYRIEHTKEGVHAVRKGPIQFVLAEPTKQLKAAPPTFVFAQEVLFAEIFKERLTLAPLPMPALISKLQLSAPRAATRDGWAGLVWNLK